MSQSTVMRPPDRNRLDEQIARSLIDAVIAGQYPPGQPLPPERELAEVLQVNRTSLRQAIARLRHTGLIETRQGHGNVVCDPAGLTDPAVVRAVVRRHDADLVIELMELRTALGGFIGRLAAARASDGDLEDLGRALGDVEAAAGAPARQQAELAYFGTLVRVTGNRALSLLIRWVEAAYGQAPAPFVGAFEDREAVVGGLRRITEAVRRRQEAAAGRAVEGYMAESGERLLQSATGVG